MKDTSSVGDVSTAAVLADLVKAGHAVLVPWGDRHRYDLVLERAGSFERVQVKTGRVRPHGVIEFNAYSNTGRVQKSYKGDAELFGVYCPDNGKTYLIPVEDVGDSLVSLRLVPPRNNQSKGVRPAEKYEIGTGASSSVG